MPEIDNEFFNSNIKSKSSPILKNFLLKEQDPIIIDSPISSKFDKKPMDATALRFVEVLFRDVSKLKDELVTAKTTAVTESKRADQAEARAANLEESNQAYKDKIAILEVELNAAKSRSGGAMFAPGDSEFQVIGLDPRSFSGMDRATQSAMITSLRRFYGKQYHSDLTGDDPLKTAKLKRINAALDALHKKIK